MDKKNKEGLYPLTLPQQALYYDFLLYRDHSKYIIGGIHLLNGKPDFDLFRKAYHFAASRYDIFRLRFVHHDGELFQSFVPEFSCDMEYLDFRNRKEPLEDATRFAIEENLKPFPFENVPLCREVFIQTADEQYVWFPKLHHFSNDGYGRAVFNRAFSETYNSLLANGTYPDLKDYSYLDFLDDDLKYRTSDAYRDSAEFWKKKLSTLPEPLDFTAKKYRIKNCPLHTERLTLNLHRMCYSSMLKIADDTGVTSFQAILGILFITLYKIYNKKDIVIGMPVLNRSNHKFRNTPGLFINMIPVRLHLSEEWSFADVLNAIKMELKESYRHQRLPLAETIRRFRNEPGFANELFDVTIIYRKMDFSQKLGDIKLHSITLDTQVRTESLSLEIDEYDDNENVNLFFDYNPLVIPDPQIVRIARCFETILFELIYSPEKPLAEVKMISLFEEHKLLKTFNQNGEIRETGQTIVSRFSECAKQYAQKTAIIENELSLSYGQLHQRVNRIANGLIENCGVSKGSIVCLAAERTPDAMVAMIGIMKAGAACLPVDSHLPAERLWFMLNDSGAAILLTDRTEFAGLAAKTVMLDDKIFDNTGEVSITLTGTDLAYIIYTSGSTGTPKGVMIEHGSFMNMFVNTIGIFGVTEQDRVLQFASLGFDAAVFEIFQALLTGASLVIAGKEIIRDPALFIRYMDKKQVSIATIPPAYLNALGKPEFPFLHTLITAGEQPFMDDVNHYKEFKKYINAYGPTEASVCATCYIAEKDKDYGDSLPIGKTVPGSSVYILNEHLDLLPAGFEGELCIAGPNLARGYLNNPELTGQKFIPDPFEEGRRMYRTGDRARLLPDGNIEFIGRVDHQIKIRGNRIEPGEIEDRLRRYEQIRDAVVIDVQQNGTRDLAAFIIAAQEIDRPALRKFLAAFLPEYMVPRYFIDLDRFPLNANGKIDKSELRKMLQCHGQATGEDDQEEVSELERKLIPIFEQVLNYAPVRVNDNFFELGGESLKTARLITRIRKELHRDVHFKAIFDHPTVRGVARELTDRENEFADEIPVAPIQEFYPLSHAQKRLWILSRDKENAAVYNMPVPLLLEGPVDEEKLAGAVRAVVQRHESLRSVIVDREGTPFQKVLPVPGQLVRSYDFSGEKDAASRADELVNREVMAPFELSSEIPFRLRLVKLSPEKYIFLMVIHHIAADGISIGIIMKELSQLYKAFRAGQTGFSFSPLRMGYKDYCVCEEELLATETYQREKEYWLKTLAAPLPVLDLQTDQMRPPVKTYSGKYLMAGLGKPLTLQLKNFAREKNVSPFMVLLAALNVLLHRYTNSEEIIVGSPVAGRNRQELENQVGLYLNTIALRNTINRDRSFDEFLQEVKNSASGAFSNANYPFDSLIRFLELERDTSRAPLFDVLMQYQPADVTSLDLDGVRSSFYSVAYTAVKFDLSFTFTAKEDDTGLTLGYNSVLFRKERIERMVVQLNNILAGVLDNPRTALKEIEFLDPAEKLMLRKMAEGPVCTIGEKTVACAFEEQVRLTPDQTALVYRQTRLTYRQLDQRANAVALAIRKKHPLKPDEVIALMTNRSEQAVIGILAILKAGGAYMPVDPDLPTERVKFMLADSGASLMLTETGLTEKARRCAGPSFELIDLKNIEEAASEDVPERSSNASSLVYVLYTSGSTGTPKGVMIENHSLLNLVSGLDAAVYGLQEDSRLNPLNHSNSLNLLSHPNPLNPLNIALISPFVFDASVKQLFFALLNGHCLDIVPEEIRLDGRKLLDWYAGHRIDVSDGTPAHLEILLDEFAAGAPEWLPHRFVIGGQQLMRQTVRKFFELAGTQKMVISNVYGPTECCDVSACLNIDREMVATAGDLDFAAMPVGKPLNNVSIFILDADLKPSPVGVNGELCIAGEGLARAYLNRPDLTAEKFVSPAWASGKRLYRTGDVGRYLDDGNILLFGRSDDQVKLRGFRIELSEIESCIRDFSPVASAVVTVTGEGNNQELAAYYTAPENIGADRLQQFLSARLPGYMIPSFLIQLENLPLTANGKIDKKALPVPVKESVAKGGAIYPADALEAKLCRIWEELLQVGQVSPADNFFRLGGHSLIAIRLVSRIHKEFNAEVSIWEVFQHPTIAALAQLLRGKNPSLFSPIERAEEKEYYPLSHAQRRMWVLSKLEGQNALYNLPASLLLKGPLDTEAFEKAWQAIVQRHESLRTCFVELDGEAYQKIADHVEFQIEMIDYPGTSWNREILDQLAVAYFDHEFDLSALPLMQIRLVRLDAEHYLFLFNMHHIIGDGWSIEIMLKELQYAYNAFAGFAEAPLHAAQLHNPIQPQNPISLLQNPMQLQHPTVLPLPPLRIHYKDYALWQNRMLEDASLTPVKEYWQKKLTKPRALLNLPADFERPETGSLDGDLLHFRLGKDKTKALAELGAGYNSSLFMTLLAAVYILLYKYTGEEDILVGSPVAGRQHDDLEDQIGFFINTLVLRAAVDPEDTFPEMLGKVNKLLTEAFDNQIYPFDRLVDELEVERIRNRNPLFDVMVAWMVKNGMEMKFSFSGIDAEGLEFSITRSMFDLTFLFEETEEGVIYSMEYSTSLFRKDRIMRMAEHFSQLAGNILANPQQKIRDLDILPGHEKKKLLDEFNLPEDNKPVADDVISLFRKQVVRTPAAVALVTGERNVSYDELDRLSDGIAVLLIEKVAAGEEDVVAVIMDDPVLTVASLLAIMKAGAAYLPLAPDTPPERVFFMLNDSRAKAVLTDGKAPAIDAGPITLDVREVPHDKPFSTNRLKPDSLAYVIYTSGSTGTPKGVMIEHGALSNLIVSLNREVYSAYQSLNELMITSFAFDVSLKQIFATLCHGNTLHILNQEKRLDPREIVRYMIRQRIQIADLTPSLFAVMMEEGFGEASKPDLLELFLGSEPLPYRLVSEFYGHAENRKIKLTNFYGPTECCVESSCFRFDPDDQAGRAGIAPIGKAILNEQIYVLDPFLNLCPIGIPGEICIAGKGLARQYLNDPEKTSRKFVQLGLKGGIRIYRTGDAGRVLPDGNIEFLGRMDDQVKIRGYRVELQEIEKQIRDLPEVRDCAVSLLEKEGAAELVAWFTSAVATAPATLRQQLAKFLPKYMIPSEWIRVEKLPLNANGKIDKKALPAPDTFRKKVCPREPQDATEVAVVRICGEVLKKDQLSLDDNFFETGGNSLNAVRLISRIRKELNVELLLKTIFDHPLLLEIAEAIKKVGPAGPEIVPGEPDGLIAPASDEELKLLAELQFDEDDE